MVQKVQMVSKSTLSNKYTCGNQWKPIGNQWQQIEQKVQIEPKSDLTDSSRFGFI